MTILVAALGWTVCVLIGVLGLAVLVLIARGKIDLSMLLSEPNGGASMSRFQLLVFTFVIGLGLFYAIVAKGDGTLPDVPGNLLALLGVSGSSYLVSKGLQFSQDAGVEDRPATIVLKPVEAVVPRGQTQIFTAEVVGDSDATVAWSIVSGPGSIGNDGKYKAPDPAATTGGPTERAIIKATSTSAGDVVAFAVVTLA